MANAGPAFLDTLAGSADDRPAIVTPAGPSVNSLIRAVRS